MEVLVSVICLAYNHEKYIRRTLESFVMQKTDFPFEVLVHDDASADGTAAVIREFEARYPEIIRPVYQTENQYSKPGVPIIKTFLLPKVRGRYIALCDGDDDWTDPEKLQKQVSYLEANPDCSICTHRAFWHTEGTPDSEDRIYPEPEAARDYDASDIIRNGAGLFATNSFLIRREAYENRPECFDLSGLGDYNTLMYAACCGRVHCLPEVMSRHLDGVAASWTESIWNDLPRRIEHEKALVEMLDRIDRHYEGRYHQAVQETVALRRARIDEMTYRLYLQEGRLEEARQGACRPYFLRDRKAARRERLKQAFPFLVKLKRRLKG